MPEAFISQDFEGTTDRYGVSSGEVIWWVPTLADTFVIGAAVVEGLPLKSRRRRQDEAKSGFFVGCYYEGMADGNEPSEETETWDGELAFSEEPIETHPDIQSLLKTYGGSIGADKKVAWPETITQKSTTTGFSSSSGKSAKNPMFGVSTYLAIGGEVVHSYVSRQLPSDLLTRVGSIVSSLPNASGIITPDDRNWLIMTPRWTVRGNVSQIWDRYKLSPKGGWPSEVYKLIQF